MYLLRNCQLWATTTLQVGKAAARPVVPAPTSPTCIKRACRHCHGMHAGVPRGERRFINGRYAVFDAHCREVGGAAEETFH